ncbi:hypothetical protein HK102_008496 [Quaeritorhiza haematococci]|nr:hypothetical protein HK102_008496 [Quaeritorhiza haematococci]
MAASARLTGSELKQTSGPSKRTWYEPASTDVSATGLRNRAARCAGAFSIASAGPSPRAANARFSASLATIPTPIPISRSVMRVATADAADVPPHGRLAHLVAGVDQDRRQRGQGDHADQRPRHEQEGQEEDRVVEVRPQRPSAADDAGLALHPARDDRQAAGQARRDVQHPHREQHPVRARLPPERVDLVDRLGRRQRLHPVDHRQRHDGGQGGAPEGRIAEQAGEVRQDDPVPQDLIGQVDQRAVPEAQRPAEDDPQHDDRQLRGDLPERPGAPRAEREQERQAHHAQPEDTGLHVPEGRRRLGQVFEELMRVVVGAEEVRQLLGDDHQADRGQHPLHHRRREDRAEAGRLEGAEHELDDADDRDDDQQQGIAGRQVAPAQGQHRGEQHWRQPGGRPADGHVRPAQQRQQQPGDDRREQARDRRGARRHRDPQRQRQRDQRDQQARRHVVPPVLQPRQAVGRLLLRLRRGVPRPLAFRRLEPLGPAHRRPLRRLARMGRLRVVFAAGAARKRPPAEWGG